MVPLSTGLRLREDFGVFGLALRAGDIDPDGLATCGLSALPACGLDLVWLRSSVP